MWMRLETLHPKALGTPTEVLFFFGCTGLILVLQAAGFRVDEKSGEAMQHVTGEAVFKLEGVEVSRSGGPAAV